MAFPYVVRRAEVLPLSFRRPHDANSNSTPLLPLYCPRECLTSLLESNRRHDVPTFSVSPDDGVDGHEGIDDGEEHRTVVDGICRAFNRYTSQLTTRTADQHRRTVQDMKKVKAGKAMKERRHAHTDGIINQFESDDDDTGESGGEEDEDDAEPVGEKERFDCFILCRVDTDKFVAERITAMLASKGIKAYLYMADLSSPSSVVSTKKAMFRILLRSKLFVPVLSHTAMHAYKVDNVEYKGVIAAIGQSVTEGAPMQKDRQAICQDLVETDVYMAMLSCMVALSWSLTSSSSSSLSSLSFSPLVPISVSSFLATCDPADYIDRPYVVRAVQGTSLDAENASDPAVGQVRSEVKGAEDAKDEESDVTGRLTGSRYDMRQSVNIANRTRAFLPPVHMPVLQPPPKSDEEEDGTDAAAAVPTQQGDKRIDDKDRNRATLPMEPKKEKKSEIQALRVEKQVWGLEHAKEVEREQKKMRKTWEK